MLGGAGLLVLGVWIWQATTLRAPIMGEHNWRQSDTYSCAYNFVHDGATFFYPRIDWSRGHSGVMGMETPVYAYVTALGMRLLGDGALAGRLLNWLCMVVGLCAVYFAFRLTPRDWPAARRTQPDPRWIGLGTLVFALLSPLSFFEGRQVQPDPMMGALTAAAAACFHAFAKRERIALYALGMLLYTCAVGAKSPAIIAGPSLWLLSFSASSALRWHTPIARGAPFVLPLALFWGWDKWAHHLNETFNGGEVYFAIDLNLREYLERLGNPAALERAFGFVFPSYASNWVLFPALLTGLILGFRRGLRAVSLPMLLWLVLALFFCVGSERLTWHWYYAFMLMLPLFYFGGVGVAVLFEGALAYADTTRAVRWGFWQLALALALTRLVGGPAQLLERAVGASYPPGPSWTTPKWLALLLALQLSSVLLARLVPLRWSRALPWLVGAVAIASVPRALHDLQQTFLWRSRAHQWPEMQRDWEPMRRALDQISTRDDLFIVDGGGNPWYLHLALRRGFVHADEPTPEELRRLRAANTRFYLHFRDRGSVHKAFRGLPLLVSGPRWELYCLDPKGCQTAPAHAIEAAPR